MGRAPVTFAAAFLAPLVEGGPVHVGAPVGPQRLRSLQTQCAAWAGPSRTRVQEAVAARAATLVRFAAEPVLQPETVAVAAGWHNLLLLGHPRLEPPSQHARRARIVAATMAFLPPVIDDDAGALLWRHAWLARIRELVRQDATVRWWTGARRFVGQPPPGRLLWLPALRRVSVDVQQQTVWRDVGISPEARPLWERLADANPLADALDARRLDPPIDWRRLLAVLRHAPLARAAAARMVEQGAPEVCETLVAALHRFAATRGDEAPGVALAVRFVAHLVWLDTLAGAQSPLGPRTAELLRVAAARDASLVFPADMRRPSPEAARFEQRWRASPHPTGMLESQGIIDRLQQRAPVAPTL